MGCVIPIILSFIVYYGFATNYTGNVFSKRGFKNQYEGGIYKYRILGKFLLLKTYTLIKGQNLPSLAPHSLALLDPNGKSEFYAAYFYLNTLFLCPTSVALILTLGGQEDETSFLAVDAPLLFLIALISIGQYVVVPYDILSYFFLSAAALLIYQRKDASVNSIVLCIVVILATLTRETAILIPAFFLSVNYKTIFVKPRGFSLNHQQGSLLLICVGYAGAYLILRLLLGSDYFFCAGFFYLFNQQSISYPGNYFSNQHPDALLYFKTGQPGNDHIPHGFTSIFDADHHHCQSMGNQAVDAAHHPVVYPKN
jgi:hypothetical protein